MDFELDAQSRELIERTQNFMDEFIYPAEPELAAHPVGNFERPAIMEDLKSAAKARGLWNLFLPEVSGLSNLQYAHVAELTGRSPMLAPEAMNCSAPDTGNMEVLHLFGNQAQKDQWLKPLLDGQIRSAFVMTEPDVASSDANNIEMSKIGRAHV